MTDRSTTDFLDLMGKALVFVFDTVLDKDPFNISVPVCMSVHFLTSTNPMKVMGVHLL